jgi:hypothetical protein
MIAANSTKDGTTIMVKAKVSAPIERKSKIPVSELNIRKTAARLLGAKLVSTEIFFVQRELGTSATQEAVDAKVIAVRHLPWASIVGPE